MPDIKQAIPDPADQTAVEQHAAACLKLARKFRDDAEELLKTYRRAGKAVGWNAIRQSLPTGRRAALDLTVTRLKELLAGIGDTADMSDPPADPVAEEGGE